MVGLKVQLKASLNITIHCKNCTNSSIWGLNVLNLHIPSMPFHNTNACADTHLVLEDLAGHHRVTPAGLRLDQSFASAPGGGGWAGIASWLAATPPPPASKQTSGLDLPGTAPDLLIVQHTVIELIESLKRKGIVSAYSPFT